MTRTEEIQKEFDESLRALREENNRENAWRFMLATARAYRPGIGLGKEEIDAAFDAVYGKKEG